MAYNLQIHIPKPCHANWDAMTLETKGRYCGSCAKTVVDFSVMTDNELLNYLNKNIGNICGHFTADQLQRPIIEIQLQPKKTWRYWIASIASLLVLIQKSSGQSQQRLQRLMGDTTVVIKDMKNVIVGKIVPQKVASTFSGIIVDEQNMPILGASILIKNTRKGTITNEKGRFFLPITDKKITVTISSVGFKTKEVTITLDSNNPTIVLTMSNELMGEVVTVIRNVKRNKKVNESVTKLDTLATCIAKVFKNEAFTIYPNPIAKNGTINIAIKEAGTYEVQILSNQSKQILSQQHSTLLVKQVVQLQVPTSALSGINYIRLINTTTKKQWVDKLMIL